jgi:MoxR-like ATPase
VADVLGWRYYEQVVTSRTEARDLLWQVDLLRRLHDAQREALSDDYAPYVQPGVLWWAFDPDLAQWRGRSPNTPGITRVPDPWERHPQKRAVVLIDEIDKADPEVPNNLLVPLGSLYFEVEVLPASGSDGRTTWTRVRTDEAHAPLVIITTNDERDLPRAFLRRCVEVKIEWPSRARLLEIAAAHFPKMKRDLIRRALHALVGPPPDGRPDDPVELSPAEFIDTVRATDALDLHDQHESAAWKAMTGMTIWKHGRAPKSS